MSDLIVFKNNSWFGASSRSLRAPEHTLLSTIKAWVNPNGPDLTDPHQRRECLARDAYRLLDERGVADRGSVYAATEALAEYLVTCGAAPDENDARRRLQSRYAELCKKMPGSVKDSVLKTKLLRFAYADILEGRA